MKTIKFLLAFLMAGSLAHAQTIEPAESQAVCPKLLYKYTISLPDSAKRFSIGVQTNCKVQFYTIDPSSHFKATVNVTFDDQSAAEHKFELKKGSTVAKVFNFTRVQSIANRDLEQVPPAVNVPYCQTGMFPITFSPMRFRKSGSTSPFDEYGDELPIYEYLLPANWKIVVGSLGASSTTPGALLGSSNVMIEPDEFSSGIIRVRAINAYGGNINCGGAGGPSKWADIAIQGRPSIKFTSGGATSVPVYCGYPTTKTFTVENANLASCITHYVWNLNATDNGWQYGGAAAPATFQTDGAANNSITLTSLCGRTPTNVSVTAYAGTKVVGSYTVSVTPDNTIFDPTWSGPGLICTADPQTYTLSRLPCNATVSWTVSPSNIVSISQNGSSVTLTPIGTGEIQLTPTVTSCGRSRSFPTSIWVGRSTPIESLTIDGVDPNTGPVCHYYESMLVAHPSVITMNDRFEWYLPGGWTALENGSNYVTTQDYMLPVYPGGDGTVYVRRVNDCGYSDFYSVYITFDPWCGYFYTVSPNPATNNITIDGQKQKKNIKEVQILDKTGRVRKVVRYGPNVQRVSLDISGLAPDIYYIKIFDGKEWKSKPIRVK